MSAPFNPRPLGRSTLVVPDVCLGTMTSANRTPKHEGREADRLRAGPRA